MLLSALDALGSCTLSLCNRVGAFTLFFVKVLKTLCTTRLKARHVISHMQSIGVDSVLIVVLTGAFTGLALALQSHIGFSRVGAEEFIGLIVTLSMTRELGPILTGLMASGRSGSAMAAELGTMRITEQIDALRTLRVDPIQYLVVPRIVASTICVPLLSTIGMFCGIVSGYIFCIHVLGINPEHYMSIIKERVELFDITGGLIKSAFFGLFLSWVGTYEGYVAEGGARGVGAATTRSVVFSAMIILAANYVLSAILFQTGVA